MSTGSEQLGGGKSEKLGRGRSVSWKLAAGRREE